MPRQKAIPDQAVFAAIRLLLAQGGDRAVAFSSVAQATGLAAPTLVQRYASRDAMLRAALRDGWATLDEATRATLVTAEGKGVPGLLRLLASAAPPPGPDVLALSLRDPELAACAARWRAQIEAALAQRLQDAAAAALIFAAWQGQSLWSATGPEGFRLKDAVRRLA